MGDADNLGKACVDALQGIVIINDRQVVRNTAERVRVNESNFTFIEVRTA
jgi:Holliday junction resolvase RusA-like endonuclease